MAVFIMRARLDRVGTVNGGGGTGCTKLWFTAFLLVLLPSAVLLSRKDTAVGQTSEPTASNLAAQDWWDKDDQTQKWYPTLTTNNGGTF